jgi:hypothetical protein
MGDLLVFLSMARLGVSCGKTLPKTFSILPARNIPLIPVVGRYKSLRIVWNPKQNLVSLFV